VYDKKYGDQEGSGDMDEIADLIDDDPFFINQQLFDIKHHKSGNHHQGQ
jgi:hypothetical protein